jgi:hypothetical protein
MRKEYYVKQTAEYYARRTECYAKRILRETKNGILCKKIIERYAKHTQK